MSSNDFILRRSIKPYIGLAVIFFLITILAITASLKTNGWTVVYAIFSGWLFFIPILYLNMRYRIILHDKEIIMKAAGGKDVAIKISEITRIEKEVSNLATLLSFRRPMRRMVIYAENPQGGKFIDVSFKHFVMKDIQKLMEEIHNQRPDLNIPKINQLIDS